MSEKKREYEREKKRKQRARRTEEQIKADNEYKSKWRKSEAGLESRWKSKRKYRLQQQSLYHQLIDAKEDLALARRLQDAAEWKAKQAWKQNDIIKMGYFEEKVKAIPGPGNRQYAANTLAQVPIDLMALAKDLEDADPKIA